MCASQSQPSEPVSGYVSGSSKCDKANWPKCGWVIQHYNEGPCWIKKHTEEDNSSFTCSVVAHYRHATLFKTYDEAFQLRQAFTTPDDWKIKEAKDTGDEAEV